MFVALTAPWFINGSDLVTAFKTEGVKAGLGQWFGSSIFVGLFLLVLFGLFRFFGWIIG